VLPLDVTQRGAVFGAVRAAHRHFGRLDIVVNNAGYALIGAVEEVDEADARALFDTNFFGGVVRQRLTRVGRRHGLHAQQEPVHVTERWLSHMMPITMKLTTLAANEGHGSQRA
jgi:NAD(P)-dependent dehydrogenase (short-subunit alcohol dehydrogenase family)